MRSGRILHHGVATFVREVAAGELRATDSLFDGSAARGEAIDAAGARWLAPVAPGKIVCVGRNYRAHAKELGNDVPTEPLIFLKPPSALLDPGAPVERPAASERVEHEGELAVVIGRRIRNIDEAGVAGAILGYACANDVTARDIQRREVQFTRAKGFDTFCPLGPWMVSERPGPDAAITVRVNGTQRQRGFLRDMVFGIDRLIAFIAQGMTLEPGDVVLTGTPEGVGPLVDGDVVDVEIDGVGTLSNPVADARIAR